MRRTSLGRRFHIGPGAASLLMIIVVLSMSVLGVLALQNSLSDLNLSDTAIHVSEEIGLINDACEEQLARLDRVLYRCSEAGDEEAFLKAVRLALPEGMEMDGDTVSWTLSSGGYSLTCSARVAAPGAFPRYTVTEHMLDHDFTPEEVYPFPDQLPVN